MEDYVFNDPVLYENEEYKFRFDDLNDSSQFFGSIDPSLTMVACGGSSAPVDDYHSPFIHQAPLSAPGTPLLHQPLLRSAPSSLHFFEDLSGHSPHIAAPTPYTSRRSFSQPPEEVTFYRGEHWLGPRVQKQGAGSKRNQKRKHQKSWRQGPYARLEPVMPRPAPTSAQYLHESDAPYASIPVTPMPEPAMLTLPDYGDVIHVASNEPEVIQYAYDQPRAENKPVTPKQQDITSAADDQYEPVNASIETEEMTAQLKNCQKATAIDLLSSVDRLRRECDSIKQIILEGVSAYGETDLHKILRELRTINGKVIDIDANLSILPRKINESSPPPVILPVCGQDVREMGGETITKILGWYGLPYNEDSFLHERKFLYLQFIGISRELMHKVLD